MSIIHTALMMQIVARHFKDGEVPLPPAKATLRDRLRNPTSAFLSLPVYREKADDLLEHNAEAERGLGISSKYLNDAMGRIDRTTMFRVSSHDEFIGYGIFPMVARVFRHSCDHNAFPVYVFKYGEPGSLKARIRTLKDIKEGEDVRLYFVFLHLRSPLSRLRSHSWTLQRLSRIGRPPSRTPQ